jgi:RND superfamily putative drug exporter
MPRWAVIGAWLLLALAMLPLQGPLQSRAADESDTFLARGSESAQAKRVIDENFRAGSESAAIIAYFREGGIGSDDRTHGTLAIPCASLAKEKRQNGESM